MAKIDDDFRWKKFANTFLQLNGTHLEEEATGAQRDGSSEETYKGKPHRAIIYGCRTLPGVNFGVQLFAL